MAQQEWINQEISSELPVLRDGGEGQRVEFKEKYPNNGNDLSKEIAAFASSNPGKIVIGVADDGALVGLDELKTAKGRDKFCRRIEGLCTNNIKPAITPVIKFAQEDGKNVLIIEVPRGQQPIYYSGNKPYIRHLSQSRPAEPHEVIERIIEWSKSSPLAPNEKGSAENAEQSRFLSALASALIEIQIFGSELDGRSTNPWLDELRNQLGSAGRTLYDLAVESIATELNLEQKLRNLAETLSEVESYRLVMGQDSWRDLKNLISASVQKAEALKSKHVDTVSLSDSTVKQMHDLISKNAKKLDQLDQRAEQMINDARIKELQNSASNIGYALLRLSYYPLEGRSDEFRNVLCDLGRGLHLMETSRLYMDGGRSAQQIRVQLHDLNERLQELIQPFE